MLETIGRYMILLVVASALRDEIDVLNLPQPTNARFDEEKWEHLDPILIERPSSKMLLVNLSGQRENLFKAVEWSKVEAVDSSVNLHGYLQLHLNDEEGNLVVFRVKQTHSAAFQVIETLTRSLYAVGGARPSTFSGSSALDISNASYVANYESNPNVPNTVVYGIANVTVVLSSRRPFPPDSELVKLANQFNTLFMSGDKAGAIEADIELLSLRIIEHSDDATIIEWTAAGDYTNNWVRIDSEHGELSISEEEDNRLILAGIPDGGTVVTIYAISPDGKEWFKKSMEIKAFGED